MKKAGRGVIYAWKKLQTRVAAVTAESSPRLAITFIPSSLQFLIPGLMYTLVVNAPILSMSHIMMSSG